MLLKCVFWLRFFDVVYEWVKLSVHIYGRPPASWPTAIIFYCWCFYHLFFFAVQSRGSLGRSSPNFATCSVVAVIFKCESEVPPPKIWGPKTSKFRISRFDREYLRTGTRYRRPENGVETCNHSSTCMWNLVNFGPQTEKNRTGISTHSIDFFGRSYLSSYLRGGALPPENFYSW